MKKNAKYPVYIVVLIYSIILLNNSNYKQIVWEDSKAYFPMDCVNFLTLNNIKARTLAPFSVSDYIAYKGYPDLKIFVNSRYEQLYPEEYLKKSSDFFNLDGERPLDILFQYPPELIIFENYRPLAANLNILYETGYTLIYRDNYYTAFIINTRAKFSYFYPKSLDITYFDYIFDTNFLKDM